MEFQEVIEKRCSIRSFAPTPLAKEDIDAILEAGRLAPTARNFQPQRMFVITKPEDLEKIDGNSPCRYGAPLVIAVGYAPECAAVHAQEEYRGHWSYGTQDAIIAFTHMILKAADLGLGSCWVGMFTEGELKKAFPQMEGVTIEGLLMVGYPAEGAGPSVNHTNRIPIEDMVTWL